VRPMPSLLRVSLLLAALAVAVPARADGGLTLAVPAGPGQQSLALRIEAAGVRARACGAGPCSPDGGLLVAPPEGPAARLDQAKAVTVTLDGGRAVARVDVPGDAEGAAWVLLVAAPLAGNPAEPVVVWSGWTGVPRGEDGEERTAAVVVETQGSSARVLVGERHADVTLCGRPALVAVRALDPATLALARGASAQSLGDEERARATKLTAKRARALPEGSPASARVLRATAASSAFEKRLAALTDGDAATAWSENKAGDGRGEFVSMSAPEEVGIVALDLIVRPTEDLPDGAAPKRFYLATPDALFAVTMPEDAWRQPAGTRYTVALPAEIHASCLAVVLDEAFLVGGSAGGSRDPHVTLAEVEARTAFDGATPDALAGALAGGGERSRAAAALLVRSGPVGVAASVSAFEKLDEAGRRLAESVIDAAPCSAQVPFFAARFAVAGGAEGRPSPAPLEVDPELAHARDRLRRCGRASAPALVELVARGAPRAKLLAADELAALAPAEAVTPLLDALAAADDATRRDLRAALARAARDPRAYRALGDELAPARFAARPETVAIDLLRAAGPSLAQVRGGAAAFDGLATPAASFRVRYLLQAPAVALALTGDAPAAAFLLHSLREDADPHVRARAAAVAGLVPDLAGPLAEALADADPRVREAALNAVAEAASRPTPPPAPTAALRERLAHDDWTFVRAGAARTLGIFPADADADRTLAAALADTSPEVRGQALDALGAHRAAAHADAVRARQDDDQEVLDVRARALLALAAMCDARSLSDWTKLARGAKAPLDDRGRRLGGAAIAALGQLHPADLPSRLAPLLEKDAPPAVREMARAAIAMPGGCR
jgi:HEAT repeats